jgi:hypothetical protein
MSVIPATIAPTLNATTGSRTQFTLQLAPLLIQ